MAVVENRFVCDLSKPVQAQALKGNVFSLDNFGSRISVLIYNNGQPATISGSITANCILPDGSTVNVNGTLTTENGGSKAYIDVPQGCLLIPGILKIAIKCTSSSVITTLAAIVANVYITKTDNVITPSQQIINDWNAEISAAIATQNAAIANQDTKINDLKSAFDRQIPPGKTSFYKPEKNLYDPNANIPNCYMNQSGVFIDNSSYSVQYFKVPAGKTIFSSGIIGTNIYRQLPRTVRQYCVKDSSGNVLSYDTDEDTAYKYTNNTQNEVTIYYSIYTNHPTVSVKDLMIQIVSNANDAVVSFYEPYQATADESIIDQREIVAEDVAYITNEINKYNPKKAVEGYYINKYGVKISDSRYAYIGIDVPAGKTVFSSGCVNGSTDRKFGYSVRQNCVVNKNGVVISYDESELTAYKYTNNTAETVTIYYSLYYNHSSYVITNLMIQIVDTVAEVLPSNYEAAKSGVTDEIDKLYGLTIPPKNTTFLIPGANIYNPDDIVPGYYIKPNGRAQYDSRYAFVKYTVPAGKTIFSCAKVNNRLDQFAYSVRQYVVFDDSGTIIASDTSELTAYKYTNNTAETVTIYYSLYYNHPSYVVTDLMTQIVDSVDDIVAPDYEPFKYNLSDEIGLNNKNVDSLKETVLISKPFFAEELETTARSISEKTKYPCLSFNIITDTHIYPSKPNSVRQTMDSLANIAALNRICFSDGVIHLGDMIYQPYYTNGATNVEVFSALRKYVKKFTSLNRKAYLLNGNHDGKNADIYQQLEWYSICGRINEEYTKKENNYFYVDYPAINTRCVFIATPDNIEDADSAIYGFTPRLLSWLVNTALDTPNYYGVIIFAHIAPFYTWYMQEGGMINKADFYGICTAYHNHTSYTGTVQSADFTGKSGTKMVAYICGHAHGDAVLAAGETVEGTSQGGQTVETTNEMPCPVIGIGCGLFSASPSGNYAAVAPSRIDKTVTQDLWDTMVYRPDLHKIYMVRFGAGNDREITVP